MAPPQRKQWGKANVGAGATQELDDVEVLISEKDLNRLNKVSNKKPDFDANQNELQDYVAMIERILGNHKQAEPSKATSIDDEEQKAMEEMILPGGDVSQANTQDESEDLEQMLQEVTVA